MNAQQERAGDKKMGPKRGKCFSNQKKFAAEAHTRKRSNREGNRIVVSV